MNCAFTRLLHLLQQVAQVLMTKGRLTLSGIVQFTKLPLRTIREALVVMIQHNICFYTEAREGLRQVCYYSIGQDEILLRLRIGRIIYWAGEWFGKEVCRKPCLYMILFCDTDPPFSRRQPLPILCY
jgi:hypothetical protein